MNATRIAPVALYEEVAERLRQRIYAHEMKPGTWVDEQALAVQYGISRTPLREALKVLAGEGLVTLKPRRGCYVTEISERDLDEIFSVLALLEGQCAADAGRRADTAALTRLTEIHRELERAAASEDIDGFFEANQAFHQEIHLTADNRWLTQAIMDLRKVVKLSRHHSLFIDGRLLQSLVEHRTILDALNRHDPAAAEQAMREHINSGRSALARFSVQREAVD